MNLLARSWGALAVRGVLGVIFGILFLVWPGAALGALVLLFGAWALIDGISSLVTAAGSRGSWEFLLEGVAGIGIAVLTFVNPEIAAIALYSLIAAWAMVSGVLRIVAAIRLRREIEDEVWLGLGGLATLIFGVLMIALPAAGMLALGWVIGTYALVRGALLIALALRLRRIDSGAPPLDALR